MSEATFAPIARDEQGQPLAGVGIITSTGQEGFTNGDGYLALQVPLGSFTFSGHRSGYADYHSPVIDLQANTDYPFTMVSKFAQITANGRHVWRNGRRYFGKSVTFFRALERCLREGADALRPALDQLKTLPNGGPNTVHVWASCWNVPINVGGRPFHICREPGGWDGLHALSDLLAEYDMDILWTYSTDHGLFKAVWGMTDDELVAGWVRYGQALSRIGNVFAVNTNNEENAHSFNKVPRARMTAPPRHLWCCSSFTDMPSEKFPYEPHGTVGMHHTYRSVAKMIKDEVKIDHPLQQKFGVPVLSDEPVRIDPILAGNPTQDLGTLRASAEAAYADGALYSAHSEDGKHCRVMGGYTYERVSAIYSEFDGNL